MKRYLRALRFTYFSRRGIMKEEDKVIGDRWDWIIVRFCIGATIILILVSLFGCGGGSEGLNDPIRTIQPVSCAASASCT